MKVFCESGLATSFFNDKNRNIGQGLMDLLSEAHQDVPNWLESIAYEGWRGAPTRRGGGGRRFNGSSCFGSRDYCTQQQRGGGGFGTGGGNRDRDGGNRSGVFMCFYCAPDDLWAMEIASTAVYKLGFYLLVINSPWKRQDAPTFRCQISKNLNTSLNRDCGDFRMKNCWTKKKWRVY